MLSKLDSNILNDCFDERLLVEAYSRLHFGLLEIHPQAPHCFGGIGLMIDRPSVRLSMTMSRSWEEGSTTGRQDLSLDWQDSYWKRRFIDVYDRFQKRHGTVPLGRIELEKAPVPHVGLGSGTQFACAASAILNALNLDSPNSASLMDRGRHLQDILIDSGRGLRSHIGLHGFLHGQMIVDQGKLSLSDSVDTPRTHLQSFPDQWRVVLVCEDVYQGDWGDNEQSIFDFCSKRENPNRARMLELIDQQILPCLQNSDYPGASHAIGLYGELAGEIFAPAVGDAYRSPRIRYWVDRFRSLGFRGVGQSSWGPVVFVIVQDDQQARWLLDKIKVDMIDGSWTDVCAKAGPAKIQTVR